MDFLNTQKPHCIGYLDCNFIFKCHISGDTLRWQRLTSCAISPFSAKITQNPLLLSPSIFVKSRFQFLKQYCLNKKKGFTKYGDLALYLSKPKMIAYVNRTQNAMKRVRTLQTELSKPMTDCSSSFFLKNRIYFMF